MELNTVVPEVWWSWSIIIDHLQGTAEAQKQLKDIKRRNADLVKLEASIKQVKDMFNDVKFLYLLEMSSEPLNRIEDQVNSEFKGGGRLV